MGDNVIETAFGSLDRHTMLLVLDPLREGTENQRNGHLVAQWTPVGGPDSGVLLWYGDFRPPSLSAGQVFSTMFIRCVAH